MVDASAKYTEVLNQLIPYIAKHVDAMGGVASLSQISHDPQVKEWLQKIPATFESKLSKILGRYSDFFALLEGGNIATFKGYETGKVDENNNIVKMPNKKQQKSKWGLNMDMVPPPGQVMDPSGNLVPAQPDEAAAANGAAPAPPAVGAAPPADGDADGTLTDMLDEFNQAAFGEDDAAFMAAFEKVRKQRCSTFGRPYTPLAQQMMGAAPMMGGWPMMPPGGMGPGGFPMFPPGKGKGGKGMGGPVMPNMNPQQVDFGIPSTQLSTKDRNDRTELVLRECIKQLQLKPRRTETMVALTQHPKILGLKKGVIQKFTTFIDQHTDKFMRFPNPEGTNKSECLELVMPDEEIAKFMEQTEPLHDDYLSTYPDLMTAEPVVSKNPLKRQKRF